MTESFEILTPDELAQESLADTGEIGDEEPEEAADPADDDDAVGVELGDPDEIAEMSQGRGPADGGEHH
jgi:hypothetical protein